MTTHTAKLAIAEGKSASGWNAIRTGLFEMEQKHGMDRPRYGIRRFERVHLPGLDVYRDEGIGQRIVLRTQRHIQMDAVRDFIVTLPLTSHSVVRQRGGAMQLEPGSFGFISTAVPFVGTVSGKNDRAHFSQILARIPGASLRKLLPAVDDWPTLSIRIRPGAARLMASMLEWALREGASLSKSQALLFSRSLLDAIVGALQEAPETKALEASKLRPAHARIRQTAIDFIALRIADPMLDVAMIARHCKVSERYVHAAFAATSLKVGGYIRQLRLEQCRAALLNPANRGRSITEIALSWGFLDSNSFSRAYKAWCGKTPRQERAPA